MAPGGKITMTVIFALLSGYCADVADDGFCYILNPLWFFLPIVPGFGEISGFKGFMDVLQYNLQRPQNP